MILKGNWGRLIDALMVTEAEEPTDWSSASSSTSSSSGVGEERNGFSFLCGDNGRARKNWASGREYFRFDGGSKGQERQQMINNFNKNKSSHLFLVSTKAGNMGSNLQVTHVNNNSCLQHTQLVAMVRICFSNYFISIVHCVCH